MANRRFNRSRGFTRGPRRQTEWLSLAAPTSSVVLPAVNKIQFAIQSAEEIAKAPFTIIRTIGYVFIEQQSIVDSVQSGAFGMCIVTERAQAVGITALPDPVIESDADFWFVYEPWATGVRIETVAEQSMSSSPYSMRWESRAQRKVEEGDRIVGVMANASVAQGVEFQIQFRMLIKLH